MCKGADQPVDRCSLISAYAIHSLEGIIYKLLACKISIIYLVSVARQAGSSLTWSQTLKSDSLMTRPFLILALFRSEKNVGYLIDYDYNKVRSKLVLLSGPDWSFSQD